MRTVCATTLMLAAMLSMVSPAKSNEIEAPTGALVVPGIVLSVVDFFLCFGNLGDVRNEEASKGRGVFGVVVGSVTVLTASGIIVGTDATAVGVGVGVIGFATVGTGIWAISEAKDSNKISVEPSFSTHGIGVTVGYRW
jgi:FtsH-binding integral membrane protein